MSNFVNLLDIVYPVGSVFISNNSVSPADSIGGTWTKLDKDTFICCGTPNTTGGANSIRLTINEMPSHNHKVAGWGEWLGTNNQNYMRITLNGGRNWNPPNDSIENTGGNQPFDNRPKYRALTSFSAQPSYILGGVA